MNGLSDYEIVYDGSYTYFDESSPINWTYKSWRGAFELKCDVNYDGIVDMTDLGIVGIAYGSCPLDSDWNRQADVYPYEDWMVEMSDLGEVARRYGQTT